MATCLNLLSGGSILLGVIPTCFSWRLHFQEDDKLLSQAKRNQIELKVQELAQRLGINKPIELIEKDGLMAAQAQGVACFSSRAGIVIDPGLVNEISEEQLEFIIAHELSHIKANDLIWMWVISSVIGVITVLAMSILLPSSAAIIGQSVSYIALVFVSKWREECADKLGLSICSDAAQRAAPELFEDLRADQIEYRNDEEGSYLSKLWRRFLITEDGEFRLDVLHPSLKNRIEYLQPIS